MHNLCLPLEAALKSVCQAFVRVLQDPFLEISGSEISSAYDEEEDAHAPLTQVGPSA